MQAPIYFSPDFSQYLDFFENGRFFTFFSLPTADTTSKKQLIRKEYVKIQPLNIPDQRRVFHDPQSGLHMIEFQAFNRIRYVNLFKVEQSFPID